MGALGDPSAATRPLNGVSVMCGHCLLWPTGPESGSVDPADIEWTDDGRGIHSVCGQSLHADTMGWQTELRATCLGCSKPLTGRQIRWCGTKSLDTHSVCSVAWSNPGRLARPLLNRQAQRCGICCMPVFGGRVNVAHMVALAAGGTRHWGNLHACHPDCNRSTPPRSVDGARRMLGLTDTEIRRRLAAVPDAARDLLLHPKPMPLT